MLVTSARVFAWARNIKIRIRVLWKYRFNLWGMVLFIYWLIHLFFAVKRKNCGVQSRRNIVHGWVNKRIPWMYANVNYLVNAWVSGNINELFCSRLSSFLVFLILEKKKNIWKWGKKSKRSYNQKYLCSLILSCHNHRMTCCLLTVLKHQVERNFRMWIARDNLYEKQNHA